MSKPRRFRFRLRETAIASNNAFATSGENAFPAIAWPTLNFASGSLSYANAIAHRFSAGVHTRLSVGCITHPCIPSGLDFFVGDLAGVFQCIRRYPSLPVVVKFFSYRGTAFAARMDFGIVE